jgi:hypothetical protein
LFQILHEEKARLNAGVDRIGMTDEEQLRVAEELREETLRLHGGR